MPRGDKSKYTDKQERMAEHIEEGYEQKGVSKDEAERRAWATVNKQTGGGNKPGGSGRGKPDTSRGSMSHAERSRAAKKAAETRKRRGRG
jgi:plasmid stabilization system protein ParE